jgi:hypothetical protein
VPVSCGVAWLDAERLAPWAEAARSTGDDEDRSDLLLGATGRNFGQGDVDRFAARPVVSSGAVAVQDARPTRCSPQASQRDHRDGRASRSVTMVVRTMVVRTAAVVARKPLGRKFANEWPEGEPTQPHQLVARTKRR